MVETGTTIAYLSYSHRDSIAVRAVHELKELWRFRACVPTFVRNNLRRRYQRSVLGFMWSLINPLLTMTIMTLVFSLFFDRQPREFAPYIFSGLLPWTFMSGTMISGAGSIVEAETFLKKMNIPKLVFPLVMVGTEASNFLLSLIALALLGMALGITFHPTILALPLAVLPTILFTFGITLALSVTTVYFRDIAHIVGVALGALFYLTPILYPISAVPIDVRHWFQFNPFCQMLNPYRVLICDGRIPNIGECGGAWALAAVALITGLFLYMWRERDIIYRL